MEQSKEKIGMREFSSIIIILIVCKATDDTPTILSKHLWNAAWMAPIIQVGLAAIPLFFLIKLTTSYEKSLLDIVMTVLGKYIGFIVLFAIWVLLTGIIVIESSINVDIIGTMYYENTPYSLLYIFFLGICAYGAKKGLQSIGSVAWIAFPYIIFSIILAFFLVFKNGVFSFLTPIFGPGLLQIVQQSAMKMSLLTDFLYIIALLFPYIKSKKVYTKSTWISLSLIVPIVSLLLVCFIIIFDYDTFRMLNYPFHELLKTIQFGTIVGPETLFLPFWLMGSFVKFSILLFISSLLFGKLFRIQQFEYLSPILATLIFVTGAFFRNPTYTSFVIRDHFLTFITPVIFFFPILLWLIAKMRGGLKNGKNSS